MGESVLPPLPPQCRNESNLSPMTYLVKRKYVWVFVCRWGVSCSHCVCVCCLYFVSSSSSLGATRLLGCIKDNCHQVDCRGGVITQYPVQVLKFELHHSRPSFWTYQNFKGQHFPLFCICETLEVLRRISSLHGPFKSRASLVVGSLSSENKTLCQSRKSPWDASYNK